MATPDTRIDRSETVDLLVNVLDSVAIDVDARGVVQPEEPDVAITAENGRDCRIASGFEATLKVFVGARRAGWPQRRCRGGCGSVRAADVRIHPAELVGGAYGPCGR